MKLRSPVILGLAFDDRSVACAEVTSRGGDGREQRRLGRFVYPPGATLAEPAACGAALRAFLDAHGFGATRAVAGVPARWLIAAERELPPSDPASSLAVLRMHGERMALAGGSELVVDVAGDVTRETSRALIVGILRAQLDKLAAIAAAAGLSLDAVTSTALVAHAISGGSEPLVLVGDSGVELVAGEPGSARLLRHVSTANVATEGGVMQLGSELKRTLALAGQSSGRLSLLDGGRLGDAQRDALAERAGVAIDRARLPAASIAPDALNGAADGLGADAFAPAVALAIAAAARPPLPVDFADSRLAPIVERRFGRRAAWGVILGVFAIVCFGFFYSHLLDAERRAAELADQRKKNQPLLDAATAYIARVATGRAYYDGRPPMLGAMREVSMAFPFEQPIWATSLTFRENREGVLQGKTTNQNLAFALRDRLANNPKSFQKVQLSDFRGAAGNKAGEQTFTINFVYFGNE